MADDDSENWAERHRQNFFRRLREEDLKVHRETIEQQRRLITRQVETISRQHETIGQLRETIARQQEKPDRQLVRENDELARGILELQRKLTQMEQLAATYNGKACAWENRHTHLREELERQASRVKHAEGRLQNAHNLAEMWRQRYEREKRARLVWENAYKKRPTKTHDAEFLLPLAYFPAGEDPATRWGLTELGERALRAGAVKGPAWVLLVSPDPREVLSIEVRAGSRQETIYRTAGYVSADAATVAGNLLGLLEAVVEVAKGEDEELGRALLQRIVSGAQNGPLPSYDLAAICARCGEPYEHHWQMSTDSGILRGLPCDGFLAAAEEQQTIRVKGAGLAGGAHYDPFHPRANEDGYVEDIEGRD